MLQFDKTRILESVEVPVQTGFTVTAEGQALVSDYTAGVFGVKPSTSGAGQFYGVSIAQQLTLLYLPMMESVVTPTISPVPTTFTVTLARTPSGNIRFYDVTGAVALTPGNPAANANEYILTGNVLTLNYAAQGAGKTLALSYRYSPTTVEALTVQGDIPPGGAANLTLGTMGVIRKGRIATTEFDTSVDWSAGGALTVGANGLFTLGGATSVPNAVIVEVPGVSTTTPALVFDI